MTETATDHTPVTTYGELLDSVRDLVALLPLLADVVDTVRGGPGGRGTASAPPLNLPAVSLLDEIERACRAASSALGQRFANVPAALWAVTDNCRTDEHALQLSGPLVARWVQRGRAIVDPSPVPTALRGYRCVSCGRQTVATESDGEMQLRPALMLQWVPDEHEVGVRPGRVECRGCGHVLASETFLGISAAVVEQSNTRETMTS